MKKAKKRGDSSEMSLVLSELDECVPSSASVERAIEGYELERLINMFLHSLPERECNIFLLRYWYNKPLKEISIHFSMKDNNVKASLFRSRKKLKSYLEMEGMDL